MSKIKFHRISVQKVVEYNDPFCMLDITEESVLKCKNTKEFLEEENRTKWYHYGRIQYFINKLKNKRYIEPILIEWQFEADLKDQIPLIYNGVHRLAAYVLTGRKIMLVEYVD